MWQAGMLASVWPVRTAVAAGAGEVAGLLWPGPTCEPSVAPKVGKVKHGHCVRLWVERGCWHAHDAHIGVR